MKRLFTCMCTVLYPCTACSDGSIRLMGGEIPSEGTVEICYRSMWGLIVNSGWTDEDASVVCRELGLPFSGL